MEKDKQRNRPDIRRALKKTGHAAAGAGLAVSLFFGSLFSSPAEIIKPEDASPPPAIVQEAAPYEEPAPFALDTEAPEEKRSLRDRLRAWLLRLPLGVRLALLLPMWAVGYAIIWAFSALAQLISVPVVGDVLKILIGALVVFGIIVLAEKLMFPDVPIKKLVSGRNMIPLAVTCGVIALAGALGGYLWKDKLWITAVIDIGAAALYTAFFLLFVKRPKRQGSR